MRVRNAVFQRSKVCESILNFTITYILKLQRETQGQSSLSKETDFVLRDDND